MKTVDKLDVYYRGLHVGTMAPYRRFQTAFEYAADWLREGFSISPFSLPLSPGVKIAGSTPFGGLFGIFADSLPDGWGRLLVDRMLRKEGEKPEEVDSLSRLSIVGASGLGALEYRPAYQWEAPEAVYALDRLAGECRKILQAKESTAKQIAEKVRDTVSSRLRNYI